MSPAKDTPVAAMDILNASHIGRATRHGYTSFVNVLPAYFAGKYWSFNLSSNKVREPSRIDPYKESASFFVVAPEITTKSWYDTCRSLQRLTSDLEAQWYDTEGDKVRDSIIGYLPPVEEVLDIAYSRESFKHSLVDLEPSREERVNLVMVRVAEAYSNVDEVSAIYVSRYLDDIIFTVLLQNTKYSRSLMDKLFEIEYVLHKQGPSLTMEFLYLPRLYDKREGIIHPKAELIYDRETSVILSGSFASGAT